MNRTDVRKIERQLQELSRSLDGVADNLSRPVKVKPAPPTLKQMAARTLATTGKRGRVGRVLPTVCSTLAGKALQGVNGG